MILSITTLKFFIAKQSTVDVTNWKFLY